jgi:uncharacterized protein with ATP-grasp and redox domains
LKAAPECIPCSVNQAIRTARMAGLDEEAQKHAARVAMRVLADLDHGAPPAVIATRAIRASEGLYKGIDPFERIKSETTAEALAMCERIKPDVTARLSRMEPVERIGYCAKLAAVGNIIDFGVSSEFDLEGTLAETLERGLVVDDSEKLYADLMATGNLLLISDNAGEIVFDRFLLDEVIGLGKQVHVSVKSKGILNDAVYKDAVEAGISPPIHIIETGSDSLGVVLEECSPEFRELFFSAGVVLSKGQANYETLDDAPRRVFFILRAKCPIVARMMNVPTGSSALIG